MLHKQFSIFWLWSKSIQSRSQLIIPTFVTAQEIMKICLEQHNQALSRRWSDRTVYCSICQKHVTRKMLIHLEGLISVLTVHCYIFVGMVYYINRWFSASIAVSVFVSGCTLVIWGALWVFAFWLLLTSSKGCLKDFVFGCVVTMYSIRPRLRIR